MIIDVDFSSLKLTGRTKAVCAVLREARELAEEAENCAGEQCYDETCDCPFCGGVPSGSALLDALDQFKFKASFTVPE